MTEIRAGISGWRYPPWRGVFYPPGLVQKRELEFASRAGHLSMPASYWKSSGWMLSCRLLQVSHGNDRDR